MTKQICTSQTEDNVVVDVANVPVQKYAGRAEEDY